MFLCRTCVCVLCVKVRIIIKSILSLNSKARGERMETLSLEAVGSSIIRSSASTQEQIARKDASIKTLQEGVDNLDSKLAKNKVSLADLEETRADSSDPTEAGAEDRVADLNRQLEETKVLSDRVDANLARLHAEREKYDAMLKMADVEIIETRLANEKADLFLQQPRSAAVRDAIATLEKMALEAAAAAKTRKEAEEYILAGAPKGEDGQPAYRTNVEPKNQRVPLPWAPDVPEPLSRREVTPPILDVSDPTSIAAEEEKEDLVVEAAARRRDSISSLSYSSSYVGPGDPKDDLYYALKHGASPCSPDVQLFLEQHFTPKELEEAGLSSKVNVVELDPKETTRDKEARVEKTHMRIGFLREFLKGRGGGLSLAAAPSRRRTSIASTSENFDRRDEDDKEILISSRSSSSDKEEGRGMAAEAAEREAIRLKFGGADALLDTKEQRIEQTRINSTYDYAA